MPSGFAPTRGDDLLHLYMLEMRDRGYSIKEIASELGVSRGCVSGALHRIDRDTRSTPDETGHLNGSMPRRWWEGGAK